MIVSVQTRGKVRPHRLKGIVDAAERLGVSRQHIYDVVHGYRRSRRIERWLEKNLKQEAER